MPRSRSGRSEEAQTRRAQIGPAGSPPSGWSTSGASMRFQATRPGRRRGRPRARGPRRAGRRRWPSRRVAPRFEVMMIRGVAEVDRAPAAVGEAALVEHLQQGWWNVAVGLLDLVEQDDAGSSCLSSGSVSAPPCLVADVAGRGADDPRDRVGLGVLAHVEADERVGASRTGPHHRALASLGLADAAGAEQEDGGDRALRAEAGAVPADQLGDGRRGRARGRRPCAREARPRARACPGGPGPRGARAGHRCAHRRCRPRCRAGRGAAALAGGAGAGEVEQVEAAPRAGARPARKRSDRRTSSARRLPDPEDRPCWASTAGAAAATAARRSSPSSGWRVTRSRAAVRPGAQAHEAGLALEARRRRRSAAVPKTRPWRGRRAAPAGRRRRGGRGRRGWRRRPAWRPRRGRRAGRPRPRSGSRTGRRRAGGAGRPGAWRPACGRCRPGRRAAAGRGERRRTGVGQARQLALAAVQRRQGGGVDRDQAVAADLGLRGGGGARLGLDRGGDLRRWHLSAGTGPLPGRPRLGAGQQARLASRVGRRAPGWSRARCGRERTGLRARCGARGVVAAGRAASRRCAGRMVFGPGADVGRTGRVEADPRLVFEPGASAAAGRTRGAVGPGRGVGAGRERGAGLVAGAAVGERAPHGALAGRDAGGHALDDGAARAGCLCRTWPMGHGARDLSR